MKSLITSVLLLCNTLCYSQMLDYPQLTDLTNQIIKHKGYVLSYNETCEHANWVKYMVTKADLDTTIAKRKNNFKEDKDVPTGSASLADYKGSGYDRGHLAPAATFVDDQGKMDESFYMSNMSPQHPSFNRGIWKKLESYERKLAVESDTVYVITGGVLHERLETIGENNVCVPELYYKIIYNDTFIMCFILKNEKSNDALYMFKQPLEVLENEVGWKFKL
jgi:endonuclease G, mitochondrial